jgi:hypothetical protein
LLAFATREVVTKQNLRICTTVSRHWVKGFYIVIPAQEGAMTQGLWEVLGFQVNDVLIILHKMKYFEQSKTFAGNTFSKITVTCFLMHALIIIYIIML